MSIHIINLPLIHDGRIRPREFRQQSRLGAYYLNELGDVVSDAALYAPFAPVSPFGALGVGSVIVLAALSEFSGALGPMIGVSRHYEGPMGKSDRAFFVGLLALVSAFVPRAFELWTIWFAVGTALTLLTCWKRLSRLWQSMRADVRIRTGKRSSLPDFMTAALFWTHKPKPNASAG